MSEESNIQNLVDDNGAETQDGTSIVDKFSSVISLPLGDSLTCEETYSISAVEPTSLVLLAGSTGCGKTTLVTSLYQQFLQSPLEQNFFAGSRTLQAFEKRAYLTRITSNQSAPQMQRTARGSLDSILHLRLWNSVQNKYKNLLLTDFSGEDYNSISANTTLAKEEFGIVKSAQVIVMLIDGEKISDNTNRHSEVQKSIHILRTLYDAELVNPNARIIIAISKYDLVFKQYNIKHEFKVFIENIPDKICKQVSHIKSQMEFCYIAAMPDDSKDIITGFGLKEFFNLLIDIGNKNIYTSSPTLTPTSEFNLFNERVLK